MKNRAPIGDGLLPSLGKSREAKACNTALGLLLLALCVAVLIIAILTYVCVLMLKNNGVQVMRADQNAQCTAANGICDGICPDGNEAECPVLAFKAADPTSITIKCTSERMCHWHTIVATDVPWHDAYTEVPGFQIVDQLADNRLHEVCMQTLDLTDAQTRAYYDGGCLKASWQTAQWGRLGGLPNFPLPPPVAKKRNGFLEFFVICQLHFACAARNPATLRFFVPT
jgi:hypothetical protein